MPRVPKGEFAPIDKMAGLHNWTGALLQNDDEVLRDRGSSARVYRQLLRDDQVGAAFEQRTLALVSKEWDVEPGGTSAQDKAAAKALKENLDSLEWDKITRQMLFATHYGYAVAECMWGRDGGRVVFEDIRVRAHERFRKDMSGATYLLTQANPQGELMPERKFWWVTAGGEHHDQVYGRGLAHRLYWPVFFKRHGMKYWGIFLEKFSQPTAAARMPRNLIEDPKQRERALEFLEAIQVDSAVIAPDDIPVELIEAARSGTGDYNTLRDAMNEAISKIVLGQTMTADDGSSLAQAKVHMSVRDDLVKADADLISAGFHRGPVQWWTEWNFPGAKPPKVWRRTEPEEDQNEKAERDNKIHALGYRPTADYIMETYGPGWVENIQKVSPVEGEQFAEGDADRALHRADQQALVDAAAWHASQYEDVLEERVTELLAYLEETDDAETFKARLADLIEAPPPPKAVQHIERAGTFARLLGAFRKQRP